MLPTCSAPIYILPLQYIPEPAGSEAAGIPGMPHIMAIVSGYQNSRWKNSVGNVTFRTTKGRIIASEKIGEISLKEQAEKRAATKGEVGKYMTQRQMTFGLIGRFAKTHESDIRESFDNTKYGSARNYFMRVNYGALYQAFASLYEQIADTAVDTYDIADDAIEQAVTNYATEHPTAIYRVRKAGTPVVYLTSAWSSAENPVTATVRIAGTTIQNGGSKWIIETGETLRIEGTGLSEGTITFGLADDATGQPTDTPIATAITGADVTDTLVTGSFAAAADGKVLNNIKIGSTVILTLTGSPEGEEGGLG